MNVISPMCRSQGNNVLYYLKIKYRMAPSFFLTLAAIFETMPFMRGWFVPTMGTPASTRIIPHLSPSKALPLKPVANRNVHHVVLGDLLFKSWYPSYYPEELLGKEVENLYVCPWCFKYSNGIIPFVGHVVCGVPFRCSDTTCSLI